MAQSIKDVEARGIHGYSVSICVPTGVSSLIKPVKKGVLQNVK